MKLALPRVRLSFAVLLALSGVIALVTARTAQPMSPPPPPGVWYVKNSPQGLQNGTSWANAFPNLDSALIAAAPDEQIWVAQGMWAPINPNTGFVITKRVKIYGAFLGFEATLATRAGVAAKTILSGQKPGYAQAPHVLQLLNVPSGPNPGGPVVVIDSVMIRDGLATLASGGGIYSVNTDLDLNKCIVTSNTADFGGGGLYFQGPGTSSVASNLHIVACDFNGNGTGIGDGGAVFGSWVKGDVVNSNFYSNWAQGNGGAIFLWNMGAANTLGVTNSVFWNNSALGTQALGGAVSLGESQPNVAHAANATFVNCTMTDNVMGWCADGQSIYISAYSASYSAIYNCILAFNGGVGCPTSNPIGEGAPATVQYTDCWATALGPPAHSGAGNLRADPLFRDHTVQGGLTVKAGSLCIDSADYDRIPADIHDLDGDANLLEKLPLDFLYQDRLFDRPEPNTGHAAVGYPGSTYLDMGAYEKYH